MNKIVLVDGNNLLFRSFYATSYSGTIMRNSKGFPTNALYGFINMMNKILVEEQPDYIMVAFDKGKTFRHEKYTEYKGKRDACPDDLKLQFPVAKEILDLMGINYQELDNYEADDIIGTYSKIIDNKEDTNGLIISSDKDLLQLITKKVSVKLLKQTGYIMMNEETFKETYKVDPINMIDLKALMGDPSDNIPGVKGIGEKTAINLLEKYTTIENLYDNIDQITGKTKEKLINDKEQAFMSKDLATIYKDIDIDPNLEIIKYRGINKEKYIEKLNELEFYSLIKKIDINENNEIKQDKNLEYEIVQGKLNINEPFSIYVEILGDNYHKNDIIGFSISTKDKNYYLDIDTIKENKELLESNILKYTYDLKKLLITLDRLGLKINNCNFDTMIAGYLLNYNVKDDIAYFAKIKHGDMPFYDEVFGKLNKLLLPGNNKIADCLCRKSRFIYDTKEELEQEMIKEECIDLFNDIEMPLVIVLKEMEKTGIEVNKDYLESFGKELEKEFTILEQEIYDLAGMKFNISSPKQLGTVLFETLEIPYPKKIKDNNYSTAKEILDKLEGIPIVDKVLRYRTLTKIYTTYVIGLIDEIKDGRVHTIFTQTLTRTGRLSSISPNLQNIPIRLEEGKLIRKAFVPDKDCVLLSSDYSQVELRIFASLSNCQKLIEAFTSGEDIHAETAADIFNVKVEDVTKDMRRFAKTINFGILYGMSTFGLAEDLKVDVKTAKEFIEKYFTTYSGVKDYMNKVIEDAYRLGYVKTIMGRKRIISELQDKNHIIRSQGERMALNTPVQGSSADILKKAMIDIYNEFEKLGLKSKMIIQVHDELVFNVPINELEQVKEIIRDKMENAYQFKVPLKVDIEYGNDWYDAK